MNVLEVTNFGCAPVSAHDNTGINRVVTALCTRFVQDFGYSCYNAYYCWNPSGISDVFRGSLHLTAPLDEEAFLEFLTSNAIDVIVFNVSDLRFVLEIPSLCRVARRCGAKTFYNIHFMPGFEALTHFDSSMTLYNLVHGTRIADSVKKRLIVMTRPLSSGLVRAMLRKRYALPLESCDKVVVFTEAYAREYLSLARSSEKDKFAVIPNPLPYGCDVAPETLSAKRKEVVMVGRLYEPTKRISHALKAWKTVERTPGLEDWTLTIVGDGPSAPYYRSLIRRYGLGRVCLAGRQNPEPYYRRASILLSTSAYEGWPMVLMECMPMGVVPCVFGSYAAANEIIDDGRCGIVAPEGDIRSFSSSLCALMSDQSLRCSMALRAIEKSGSFAPERICALWKSLFSVNR